MVYQAYTDGSAVGHYTDHTKKTSFAFIVMDDKDRVVLESSTGFYSWALTSNRMELIGVVACLSQLLSFLEVSQEKSTNNEIVIHTDSKYVSENVPRIGEWIDNKWIGSSGKIAHSDLWRILSSLMKEFKSVKIEWVKGHAGVLGNEYVDACANDLASRMGRVGPLI